MFEIKQYQVAFYDNAICYDETFYSPDEFDIVAFYIESLVDNDERDKVRIFVHFKDGRIFELKLEQVCKLHED